MSRRDLTVERGAKGIGHTRRRFVQGMAAAASALLTRTAFGDAPSNEPTVLSGDRFDLVIEPLPVNITGRRVMTTAGNLSLPGPTLSLGARPLLSLRRDQYYAVRSAVHERTAGSIPAAGDLNKGDSVLLFTITTHKPARLAHWC